MAIMIYRKHRVPNLPTRKGLSVWLLVIVSVSMSLFGLTGRVDASDSAIDSGESPEEAIISRGALAVVSEDFTSYSIVFDGDGNFEEAESVKAVMPEGVTVEGYKIDISGLTARSDAAPIEGNPQWFMELEATPRIGMDVQLTGESVVEYTEEVWGPNPVLVDPVRLVQQGRQETSVLSDGSKVTGCAFVGRSTTGRQVSTSLVDIAYDPDTCKRIVEFGVLVDSPTIASDTASTNLNVYSYDSSSSVSSDGRDSSRPFQLEVPDYRAKTRSQVH